jgi:phage host-nuclease inhibitor protein Gam
MAKTDFELYSKTRVYVYDLDTTLDKMVKHKKPRLGDKIGDKIQEITNNYTENAWVLKLDIKGFFMSIDKGVKLYKAIADSVFSTYVKNYHYKYIKLNTI